MRYSEFKDIVTNKGFNFEIDDEYGYVYVWYKMDIVCTISIIEYGVINIYSGIKRACDELDIDILDTIKLFYELNLTELNDREDNFKYYYKVKPEYRYLFSDYDVYLNYNELTNEVKIGKRHSEWESEFDDELCDYLESKYDLSVLDKYQIKDTVSHYWIY